MSVEWNNLDQLGRAELTGYEAGKRDENQRIIKLLEDLAFQINSVEHNPREAEGAYRAVELIKGENK